MKTTMAISLSLLWALAGCDDYKSCPAVTSAATEGLPLHLSETGLYADLASETLAPGVRPYHPSYALWSDGAEKRRWILLPEGATIDTTDPDDWRFPAGTRLWKEFTRDGVRVETRLLEKLGPNDADWAAMSYVWDDTGDALATPAGKPNARGTAHDVPAADRCMGCHGGRKSRVLGFSALQLAHPADPGELDLAGLVDEGRLSRPMATDITPPGDADTRAALGYLHANCGHCHNQTRPDADGPRCFDPQNDLDFWLRLDKLASPEDTPTYESAVGHVFKRGDADGSKALRLMQNRDGGLQMPPLATEKVDREAVDMLSRWVDGLAD